MLRRGTPIAHYIDQLQRLDTKAGNIINSPDPVMDYIDWVDHVEGHLRALYTSSERAEHLMSRRYWALAENGSPQYMYKHLTTEIDLQRKHLRALVEELQELLKVGERPGQLVTFDTNVLLHFNRIDLIKWHDVVRSADSIRLVIPVLVLDELDEKRYTGSQQTKKAARTALRPLEDRLADLESRGYADLPDGTTVEYFLAGGDKRPGNPDADILDQAELLQHVAAREVTVATGDLGMRQRAVTRGMKVATMPPRFARDQDEAKGEVYDA